MVLYKVLHFSESLNSLCESKWIYLYVLYIYIYIYIYIKNGISEESSNFRLRWFSLNLSDSKSLKISRTLLSILSILLNLNSAVVWMILILPLIFNSLNLFSRSLGSIPSGFTAIVITIPFKFYCFFSSLARSKYRSIFLLSFIFTLWSTGMAKSLRFLLVNQLLVWSFMRKFQIPATDGYIHFRLMPLRKEWHCYHVYWC